MSRQAVQSDLLDAVDIDNVSGMLINRVYSKAAAVVQLFVASRGSSNW
jgi:hypothetical protein